MWYNIYLIEYRGYSRRKRRGRARLLAGPATVSDLTGYGYLKAKIKARRRYKILVINWHYMAKRGYKSEYTLSTYGEKSKIRLRKLN